MSGIVRGGQVGRYDLVQVLGEGGMGTVWLAHLHDAPDQMFAVKTVSAQYAADPRVCAMFVKEASLAAAIDHPNVVRLVDVGIHQGVPFFVMEWIDGHSLRDVARAVADTGERVPAAIALRIASDLCGGLHAAHELRGDNGEPLGLVHRDVSPHNVLVTMEGNAKLIDFGVAKARDLATGADASVAGGLKGKVRYMAPEQALEQEIDRRADLFSVGAVVYQLLTGRAPFEGPNELAVINALLSTNPVYVPEDLPEPVQWILRRALSRKPEQRFADAAEMQNAIELALVELAEPDTHAHVAECLAWFDPREEDEEITSQRDIPAEIEQELETSTQLRAPGSSTAPSSPRTSAFPSAPRVSVPPSVPRASVATPAPAPAPVLLPKPPTSPIAFALTPSDSIPARQSSLVDLDEGLVAHRAADNTSSWRFVLMGAGFVGLLGIAAALLAHEGPRRPREPTVELDSEPDPASTSKSILPTGTAPATSPTTPVVDLGDVDDGKPRSSPRPRAWKKPPPIPAAPPPSTPAKSGDLAGPVKVWK